VTIIAGFSRVGDSAIAGDTLASNGYMKFTSGSKIFSITNQIAVGLSGSYVIQEWIEEDLADLLRTADPMDDTQFISKLRKAWRAYRKEQKSAGMGTTNTEGTLTIPGSLLVVTPIGVYVCQTDGAVIRHELYGAIGSGAEVALGTMHALSEPGMTDTVAEIVEAAVAAAIAHVPSCGGEIDIIEVKSE
jgi:ATP-dependent protease HslVU (ClpYQ) peptidase subunit